MKTHEIETRCPVCARINTVASHHEDNPPVDGDYSMCWGCKTVSAYDATADGGLRELTDEEMAEAMADPGVRQLIYAATFASGPLDLVRRVAHAAKNQSWGKQ